MILNVIGMGCLVETICRWLVILKMKAQEVIDIIVEEDFDKAELNQVMDYCWKRLKSIRDTQRRNEKEINRMFSQNPVER